MVENYFIDEGAELSSCDSLEELKKRIPSPRRKLPVPPKVNQHNNFVEHQGRMSNWSMMNSIQKACYFWLCEVSFQF